VKCDEQKPFCNRCAIAGRVCDGYKVQNQFVVFVAPQRRSEISDGFDNNIERRFFDYFRSISAIEFSRFFDEEIWKRLVLQAAHAAPAVKHAVIAVASSHESFKAVSTQVPWNLPKWPNARYHAQVEYNKAIRLLRIQLEQEKSDCLPVVLTCGLLFCCLEVLGGNAPGALAHLGACINILNGITSKPGPAPKDIIYLEESTTPITSVERDLVPIFTRLDSMASQGVIGRQPAMHPRSASVIGEPHADLSYSFSSLTEASQALFLLEYAEQRHWNEYMFIRYGLTTTHGGFDLEFKNPENFYEIPLEGVAKVERNLTLLASWRSAFSAFLQRQPPKTETESNGSTLLKLNQRLITMKEQSQLTHNETAHDAHHDVFVEMVETCWEIFRKSTRPPQGSKKAPPTWSAETGITRIMRWLIFKCRDGRLRRQALYMLERSPQEGIWVPDMEAPPLRRMMEMEEGIGWGSSDNDWPAPDDTVFKTYEDIPEWKRVHWGWKVPVPGQRQTMWNAILLPNGPEGGWVVKSSHVDWLPEEGVQ
jgi:hypothetical protein